MNITTIPTGNASGAGKLTRVEAAWPALRQLCKDTRRDLTDEIQVFAEYVGPDGIASTRPDLAYLSITRTIYAGFALNKRQRELLEEGKKGRDSFNATELLFLQTAESTAVQILSEGMAARANRAVIKELIRDECRRIGAMHIAAKRGFFPEVAA